MRYNKLPLDLYVSKENSIKIKNLVSVRLYPKNNNDKDKKESLLRYSYNNGIFDNAILKLRNSIETQFEKEFEINCKKFYLLILLIIIL